MLGSRERHHSVCRVASLCEYWELHNTSVCHHVFLHICDFSTDVKLEQRTNIKFCVKLGKSGTETFQMRRRAYRNEDHESKTKLQLKGRRFDRVEEIQLESQNVLDTLREQDFQHAFQ